MEAMQGMRASDGGAGGGRWVERVAKHACDILVEQTCDGVGESVDGAGPNWPPPGQPVWSCRFYTLGFRLG